MNRFITIIATVLFCAAVSVQAQTSIKPEHTYHQDGITIVSPNQSGWIKRKTDKSETAFEKRTETDLLSAGVKTIQTKPFETDKDRLTGWEALKWEELSKFKQDHMHFNYTKLKGATCTLYDAIFPLEKTASNNFVYLNLRGYVCSITSAKDSALQIEFSDYSDTRGFTEDLHSLAEAFFEKLTFPKQKLIAVKASSIK